MKPRTALTGVPSSAVISGTPKKARKYSQAESRTIIRGSVCHRCILPRRDYSSAVEKTDRQILALLAADGRMSFTDLGKATGLSTSAVHQRVKRLEQRGLILGYGATVNHDEMGLPLTAFISIRPIDPSQPDDYPERLRRSRRSSRAGRSPARSPTSSRCGWPRPATSRTCSPGSARPPTCDPHHDRAVDLLREPPRVGEDRRLNRRSRRLAARRRHPRGCRDAPERVRRSEPFATDGRGCARLAGRGRPRSAQVIRMQTQSVSSRTRSSRRFSRTHDIARAVSPGPQQRSCTSRMPSNSTKTPYSGHAKSTRATSRPRRRGHGPGLGEG